MAQKLAITRGKGIHITLDNGFVVSIQIGPGNYCDNYDKPYLRSNEPLPDYSSETAEIAVWEGPKGEMIVFPEWGDTVKGYVPMGEVWDFVDEVRSWEPGYRPSTEEETDFG